MMPTAKHGDPQLGIDIHLCVVPPSPWPVPLPTPHLSLVFDPFDYVPIIGATVKVLGMKRATAGTAAIVVHIPPGFPFAPMLPEKDDELFMGSATVVADGDPLSHLALPVLGCQVVGMPSPPRPKKKKRIPKPTLLPTTFNLAIPGNVVVGGPPTISLMGLAARGAFAGLGKLANTAIRGHDSGSGLAFCLSHRRYARGDRQGSRRDWRARRMMPSAKHGDPQPPSPPAP